MTKLNDLIVYGLQKINSVDFIKNVFQLYTGNKVIAFLDSNASSSVLSLNISKTITPDNKYGWYKIAQAPIESDTPAQIVFTSGTEGDAKALLISHRALADVVYRLNKIMNVDSSIKEYIGVPVSYSFGLGRCRAVAAAGGCFYIPENGFNPIEIKQMLDSDEINAISAVPSLWRMVLGNPDSIGTSGLKVKWIEIGSQYMSKMEKEQMKSLFPNATIIQHYGLTEASRSTFLDISNTEGKHLESVGKAYGEVKVGISDDNRIMLKGPNLAMGSVIDQKIVPIVDDDSWLITNDSGHIEDGYLYFDGRSDDIINFGGIKINPEQLQQNLDKRLPAQNAIAISRIADSLRGDGIFIAVEKKCLIDFSTIKDSVLDELNKLGINAASSLKIQHVDSIPRTETGKVKRKALATLYKETDQIADTKIGSNSVYGVFKKIFPKHIVCNEDSFKDLGGDSLNYVQLSMMLEKYLGHLPHNWDQLSINDLEKNKSNTTHRFSHIETASFLRALAILFIVGTHAGVEILGGGTLLLFFLVGYNFSRFKSTEIIENKIWSTSWSYIKLVLVPYYLLAAVYLTWNKSFEPDVLLLYANLLEAKITVIFPFWFVQVLVQCLVLIALLFSLSYTRNALKKNPWLFSFSALIILIFIRAFYPYIWDTSHLNNLVPLRFMAILWLGWCFNYADTTSRKILLILSAIIFTLIDTGLQIQSAWLIIGSISMAFIPYIIAPHMIKHIIQIVASATFYIFVFNGVFIYFILQILKFDSSLVAFGTGLTASMIIWWLTEYIYMNDKLRILKAIKYRK
jgi:acyl-CoA synthetase (AMP-forming)/AMP-acid ligase II